MLTTIRQLGKHSANYGLGSLLAGLLGLVLLPVYTRYLTPADYGILSLLGVTGSIAGIIAQLGIGSALFREVIYEESDESKAESTALYFLTGVAAVFFGTLIASSLQLSELIFGSIKYAHLLRLVFLTGILGTFNIVAMARLRIRKQSSLYATLSVVKFIVAAGLNIYFIAVLRRGVEGLITAGLILAALFAFIYLALLFRDLQLTFSIPILCRMLKFGVPLVPANLSNLVMTSADRYFLQAFSTSAEVGLYSLGYNISMMVYLVVGAIQVAWPAEMFNIAKQADAERQFAKMLTYYLTLLGLVGLGVSVLSDEVLVIMTPPRFYGASTVVPLIVLSYIFYGIRFMTNIALPIQNRMKYMPPIIISSAVLNLVLNYLLIPRYGMIGAAWATLISYFVLVLVQILVNLHFWYISYEYKRIAKIAFAGVLIYGCSLLIQTTNILLNLGLKLVLLATYPLILYVLHFYEKRELTTLKRLFRSGIHLMRARVTIL